MKIQVSSPWADAWRQGRRGFSFFVSGLIRCLPHLFFRRRVQYGHELGQRLALQHPDWRLK